MPPVQYGGDEVGAVVLDIGRSSVRAGYAGEDAPKCVFPTTYATVPADAGSQDGPKYIHGIGANLYRPNAVLSNPIIDGIVTDWDALSRTLDHAFKDRMRLQDLSEYPLLVTEPCWNTKENKERMCQLAFEDWKVPAYYAVDKAVMSAFATGKGSAVIVDIGDELTTVTPVYDGFVLRKAVQKQPAAGALLSEVLLSALESQQPPITVRPQYLVKTKEAVPPNEPPKAVLREERLPNPEDASCPTTPSYHKAQLMRVMHEMKESVCEVNAARDWNDEQVAAKGTRSFEFPDGFNTYFGPMRLRTPEVLFNPSLLPQEFTSRTLPSSASSIASHPYSALQPVQKLFTNSLMQIDPDLHPTLYSNVVVTGGGSLVQGFVDRLQIELAASAASMKLKIHAPATPAERSQTSWLGGSILASLGTFHQLWIGRDEWEEVGSSIVHRRMK
ncbi:NuA4 histone acetyltransferase subunit [Microbotryomycetes sp. JL201]|nr:NuA4 histone acetyltransferase subunit [Microbotryomycetes sp. JL201]